MNRHKKINKLLVDFALGELSQQENSEMKTHLAECPQCSSELNRLETLLECTERIRELSVDKQICESAKQAILASVESGEMKQQTTRPNISSAFIWRTIMKSPITKLAAAAVIIVVVILALHNGSIDIASPAFGVEDVLDAMTKAEWVHCIIKVTELNVDAEAAKTRGIRGCESWQSVHPSCSIEKHDNGKIYFTEKDIERTSRYDPETNRITVEYKYPSSSQETYASIADMYIKQIAEVEKRGGKVKYEESIYEGRPVKIISIDFASDGGLHTTMSIIVDPETYLPQKFTAQQTISKEGLHSIISGIFDYPESAPTDIYQAGAPHDAEVKIIDDRPDPEFLQVIKSYQTARENIPPKRIVVDVEVEDRSDNRVSIICTNGRNERFEERMGVKDNPRTDDFYSLLKWGRTVKADSVGIHFYDGEYIYSARRDYEDYWSIKEKQYSPKHNSRSYVGGLADRGWPGNIMYKGKLVQNEYAKENNLLCIEKQREAKLQNSKLFYPAQKTLYYIDPEHNYICVRQECFQHRIPPHDDAVGISELDFEPQDTPNEPFSVTEVIEFGQTDEGQWYPKKFQKRRQTWIDRGYGWETSEETKIITLYLKINPEFPDGIFDPNSLVPTGAKIRKEGEKTTFERYFEQAITVIDSRQYWPEPEELVKIYWQARAKKNYEEMAILWPGSASWNSKVLENEKPVEYVFGEVRKAGDNRVIVPYAAKSYYEKNGTYNLKMWLDNKKSTKDRYYITSGN